MNGSSGAAYSLVGRHFIKTWPYHLRQKALDEIYWYKTHSCKFRFFPEYYSSSQEHNSLSLSIERLVDYTSLLDRFSTYTDSCSDINTLYCNGIDKIFDEMHSFKSNIVLSQREWLRYLFKQTSNRIMSYCGKNALINKLTYESVVINDISYLSISSCLQLLEQIISGHCTLLSSPQKAVLCHGDPHAGNIMTNGQDVKLIDPRGRFINSSAWFSPLYDEGKIIHDVFFEYSNIVSGKFRSFNDGKCWHLHQENNHYNLNRTLDFFNKKKSCGWLSYISGALLLAGVLPFHYQRRWLQEFLLISTIALNRAINPQTYHLTWSHK